MTALQSCICHVLFTLDVIRIFFCFVYYLTLFQEPGTWTPTKPFDQGGCEEEILEYIDFVIKKERKKENRKETYL